MVERFMNVLTSRFSLFLNETDEGQIIFLTQYQDL